jgi:hypothetical protein
MLALVFNPTRAQVQPLENPSLNLSDKANPPSPAEVHLTIKPKVITSALNSGNTLQVLRQKLLEGTGGVATLDEIQSHITRIVLHTKTATDRFHLGNFKYQETRIRRRFVGQHELNPRTDTVDISFEIVKACYGFSLLSIECLRSLLIDGQILGSCLVEDSDSAYVRYGSWDGKSGVSPQQVEAIEFVFEKLPVDERGSEYGDTANSIIFIGGRPPEIFRSYSPVSGISVGAFRTYLEPNSSMSIEYDGKTITTLKDLNRLEGNAISIYLTFDDNTSILALFSYYETGDLGDKYVLDDEKLESVSLFCYDLYYMYELPVVRSSTLLLSFPIGGGFSISWMRPSYGDGKFALGLGAIIGPYLKVGPISLSSWYSYSPIGGRSGGQSGVGLQVQVK